MERQSSMSDSAAAMDSLSAVISELRWMTGDSREFLRSKLMQKAEFAYNIANNVDFDRRARRDKIEDEYLHFFYHKDLSNYEISSHNFMRDEEMRQLYYDVTDPNLGEDPFSVIPIVGVDGIGKTTLARNFYDDSMGRKHFELKAWVKVAGQEVNSNDEIARRLLKSAMGMICPLNSRAQLDEMVSDALRCRRSLIVLDEVETMAMESWSHMKDSWFRFVGRGSMVIITTRSEEVVTMVGGSRKIKLKPLSDVDSLSVFRSEASPGFGYAIKLFISVAPQLAARCNGLPLSLKLLARLMRNKRSLLEDLSSAYSTSDLDVLSLSVLALPDTLFKCFAYCGIFPCGYELEAEKLIRMWIAEGVIKPSRSMTMEDSGKSCFRQLVGRSFFTDVTRNEDGDIVQARMPRAIHELALRMAAVVYKDKVDLQSFVWRGCANNETNYIKLKNLQSLDLSRSGICSLPDLICRLRELRYLNLSHTFLQRLPNSFTDLHRLQTLDLSECYHLKVLPQDMGILSELAHLDLSNCNALRYMPSGIDHLYSLVTMPLYVLGAEHIEGAGLRQLGSLKKLRGVLHIRNLENVEELSDAQAANLKNKGLHHLGLSWRHKVDECSDLLEYLKPNPKFIKVLHVRGYGDCKFPSWMSALDSLVKLSLEDCECTELPTLGQLLLLKELQLKRMTRIKSISPTFYGDGDRYHFFPSLEKLKLHEMPNLRIWSYGQRLIFPSLMSLSIQGCDSLETIPPLHHVKELVVWRSHSKILQSLTGMESLSSIVINDMNVKEYFESSSLNLVLEKLIVIRSMDLDCLSSSHIKNFTALNHLRLLHCVNLDKVELSSLRSLKKLNIVDCQNLNSVEISEENSILTELVIEDCPELKSIGHSISHASSLRKLIVRNCPRLSFSPAEIELLKWQPSLDFFHET